VSAAPAAAVPWLDPDGEEPLVGSLAVNPADDALWMSTNQGLYRVSGGGAAPEKVTGTLVVPGATGRLSEQLVVRFTGPDELLASGHPGDEQGGLPPVLGLLRSKDAGTSWTAVSELGRADFHAIERSGGRVIGALFGESQVLVSYDDGASWQGRAAPAVLVDLAVHPSDPARWVASSADGLFVSRDEGGTWRPVDRTPGAYVDWPAPDALYRIDPGGTVRRSSDGGRSWEEAGSAGGDPLALSAADADTLYAALSDGSIRRSDDGGRTWSEHLAPSG
jgi:photosystem II stability/assembly factor-like uncharacterized protein